MVVTPHCGAHSLSADISSNEFFAGAAARSPLKTIHWIVFRAFRTHGDCSLEFDLTSDEISATGGRQSFAHFDTENRKYDLSEASYMTC